MGIPLGNLLKIQHSGLRPRNLHFTRLAGILMKAQVWSPLFHRLKLLSQRFRRIGMPQMSPLSFPETLSPGPGGIRLSFYVEQEETSRGIFSILWRIFKITVHKFVLVSHCPRNLFFFIDYFNRSERLFLLFERNMNYVYFLLIILVWGKLHNEHKFHVEILEDRCFLDGKAFWKYSIYMP